MWGKLPMCETTKEDDDALWNIAKKYLYKYNYPKDCLILEYSGKIDYWAPKYQNPNNTMIIYLKFQSPEVLTIYEEYFLYNC